MKTKQKNLVKFSLVLLLAMVAGLISYPRAVAKIPFLYDRLQKLQVSLGLDLQGGVNLEYKADVSGMDPTKVQDALQGAQDMIEQRVNAFGVGEPLVQVAKSDQEYRIVVQLPGIKDVEEAKKRIGETPNLEFKEIGEPSAEIKKMFDDLNVQNKQKATEILAKAKQGEDFAQLATDNSQDPGSKDKGGDLDWVKRGNFVPEFDKILFDSNLKAGDVYPDLVETQFGWHIIKIEEIRGEGDNLEVHARHILFRKQDIAQYPELSYQSTGLTGKNLKAASVGFSQQGVSKPQILLQFDEEGTKLFGEITKRNLGKKVAIYLDDKLLSDPVVQAEIMDGRAEITGDYTTKEARQLAQRLNQGALPVPLSLASQQSVEASLGAESLALSLKAGLIGLGAVVVFMLLNYRFLGLVASFALLIYASIMLSLFKLFPGITLTLSGIAGFILSIGMAVDANILIFERTKEELHNGRTFGGALEEGFKRAWTSIRDGNISTLLTSAILYELGTGFVKGFAATLGLGVMVSMFTAIVISRTLLRFFLGSREHGAWWIIK